MLETLIRQRWEMVTNLSKEIGLFLTILFSFAIVFLLYLSALIEQRYAIAGLLAVLMILHYLRKDIQLLAILFGKKYRITLLIDYLLISALFLLPQLLAGHFLGATACCLSPIIVAILPFSTPRTHLPSHPLFVRGGILYQSGSRLFLLPYLALCLAAVMGAITDNFNLVYACTAFNGLFLSLSVSRSLEQTYLLHYKDSSWLIKWNTIVAVTNVAIIQLPFIIVMLVMKPDMSQLLLCVEILLSSSLLVLQCYGLRFFVENAVVSTLILLAFFFINWIVVLFPIVLIVQALITAILFIGIYFKISRNGNS
jgi:hypothetical protein